MTQEYIKLQTNQFHTLLASNMYQIIFILSAQQLLGCPKQSKLAEIWWKMYEQEENGEIVKKRDIIIILSSAYVVEWVPVRYVINKYYSVTSSSITSCLSVYSK